MSSISTVRVTVRTADLAMHSRDFVPGPTDMSQQAFNEFALGSLIALVTSGCTDTLDLGGTFLGASYGDVALTATAGHVLPFEPPVIDHGQIVTGWAVEIIRG